VASLNKYKLSFIQGWTSNFRFKTCSMKIIFIQFSMGCKTKKKKLAIIVKKKTVRRNLFNFFFRFPQLVDPAMKSCNML